MFIEAPLLAASLPVFTFCKPPARPPHCGSDFYSLSPRLLLFLSALQILAHPAVKAVVSHCGMGAAQEALLFGKPLLCLPMLADQEVRTAVRRGHVRRVSCVEESGGERLVCAVRLCKKAEERACSRKCVQI